ncbi:hypothetical protein SAMN05421678_10673 [Actinopolymorpha cephalotaxi]|uniref:Uncharacterized protein n=1 Tax=Actinopolymorpha cephalotaxi TaxID=504797 RepID=A0A1I2S1P3_9ACTN|nr:hypothetical protein [Actinopolymorpha cephalotaxi]NYH83869.1 hypothetical protein [Actinopolymorpha cephalotaxi]SFG46660.1 hypothetical protein SAMN05421678_10673 [Actinopolymorpha cephalotaxi]
MTLHSHLSRTRRSAWQRRSSRPRRSFGLAGLAVLALGVTAGCGPLGALTDSNDSAASRTPEPSSTAQRGDISLRKLTDATGTPRPAPTRTATPTPSPTVTLTPLPRPTSTYPAPKLPSPPKDAAPELERIRYRLETIVWASAGEVDEKGTKSSCSKSEDDIIALGTYKFTCDVRLDDVRTTFAITATVKESEVNWGWSAAKLPVTEKKAVYEATRQAFRPARVTCDITDLEAVEVGTRTGLTCWVTDVYNERVTYHGKLLPNGALAFEPDGS